MQCSEGEVEFGRRVEPLREKVTDLHLVFILRASERRNRCIAKRCKELAKLRTGVFKAVLRCVAPEESRRIQERAYASSQVKQQRTYTYIEHYTKTIDKHFRCS